MVEYICIYVCVTFPFWGTEIILSIEFKMTTFPMSWSSTPELCLFSFFKRQFIFNNCTPYFVYATYVQSNNLFCSLCTIFLRLLLFFPFWALQLPWKWCHWHHGKCRRITSCICEDWRFRPCHGVRKMKADMI